ncbi:hypothetical protein QOT17_012760 [Balamuthia mandrillaris]
MEGREEEERIRVVVVARGLKGRDKHQFEVQVSPSSTLHHLQQLIQRSLCKLVHEHQAVVTQQLIFEGEPLGPAFSSSSLASLGIGHDSRLNLVLRSSSSASPSSASPPLRSSTPETQRRPVMEELSPNRGPETGGTLVKVTGRDFHRYVMCRFGDLILPVDYRGETQLRVVSPPHSPASVLVQLSNDLGATWHGAAEGKEEDEEGTKANEEEEKEEEKEEELYFTYYPITSQLVAPALMVRTPTSTCSHIPTLSSSQQEKEVVDVIHL